MVTLWCDDLDEAIGALRAAGMRLDVIMPADSPAVAELSGNGVALRVERRADAPAPDTGRAGMVYRDLLPGRAGGRFIGSHITIPVEGPVPDYVHHHDVRFQVIHCVRGWVRVVYEDQGGPFTMHAGDTVLQPPHIRHRVLESSAGLEVVELSGPAEHPTFVEHDIELPTAHVRSERVFGGQRFVRHELATATWTPWRGSRAMETADTGIGAATAGLGGTRTVRATRAGAHLPTWRHDGELVLWFVESGAVTVTIEGAQQRLDVAAAIEVPAGVDVALSDATADLRFYEITLPA